MKPSGGPSQQLAWPRPLAGETHPHHCPLAEAQTALHHSVPYHCDSVSPHPTPQCSSLWPKNGFIPFRSFHSTRHLSGLAFPWKTLRVCLPCRASKSTHPWWTSPWRDGDASGRSRSSGGRWKISSLFKILWSLSSPLSEYLEVGFCVFKRKPALVKLKDHVEEFIPISSPPSVFLQQTQLKENYLDWYNSIKL